MAGAKRQRERIFSLPEPIVHQHADAADENRLENDHEDDRNREVQISVDRIKHAFHDHRGRIIGGSRDLGQRDPMFNQMSTDGRRYNLLKRTCKQRLQHDIR